MILFDVSLDPRAAEYCLRLAQSLLHFLWQGTAIGLVALLAARTLRGGSAVLRYGVYVGALVTMVVCLPVTFLLVSPRQRLPITAPAGAPSDVVLGDADTAEQRSAQWLAGLWHSEGRPASGTDETQPVAAASDSSNASEVSFATYIAVAYLLGVAVMLCRLTRAAWEAHRLQRRAIPLEQSLDARLLALMDQQARRIGMRFRPATAWCRDISVPAVVGLFKPVILLPAWLATGLSPEQLQALLTHEMAHIRRCDPLVHLCQRLGEALLFFHPAVWFVSRGISLERENCCDDYVLKGGCGRVQYAEAMLRVAELCLARRGNAAAARAALLAASGTNSSEFKQRILRILRGNGEPHLRPTHSSVAGTLLVLGTALLAPVAILCWVDCTPAADAIPAGGYDPQQVDAAAAGALDDHDNPAPVVPEPVAEPRRQDAEQAVQEYEPEKSAEQHGSMERLGLHRIDIATQTVASVATEPNPGLAYCGSPTWLQDGRIFFDATPGMKWNRTRLMTVDASDKTSTLTDLGPGNCPAPSPDGQRVAFLLNPGAVPDAKPGIWLMQADGTDRRRLSPIYGIPKWSPDGRFLLVISFSNPCELALLDVETGQHHPVQPAGYEFRSVPSWGGDGDTLVAVIRSAAGLQIALIDIRDPGQARIKQVLWQRGDGDNADPTYPVYSAAANRCAFVGREENGSALYVLEPERPPVPRRLEAVRSSGKIASLAFSPEGRHLLFCSNLGPEENPEEVVKASGPNSQ